MFIELDPFVLVAALAAGHSILAAADGDGAAGDFDRFARERDIGDLLDGWLLVRLDVAILGAVIDRPLRAIAIEPGVDRPDAIPGQDVESICYRLPWLVRGLLDDRDHLLALAKHGAVGLDHGGNRIAQERAIARDPTERRAIGIEHVARHEVGE